MGLYLWREVSATPAPPESSRSENRAANPPLEDRAPPEPEKPPVAAKPEATRVRDTTPIKGAPPPPTNTEPPALSASDPIAEELAKPNPKLDLVMSEANKAYDHGDFDEAKGIAQKVLAKDPSNVRMLRIAVSAACIDGDSNEAQRHYALLPAGDREAMKIRCSRYGISFADSK